MEGGGEGELIGRCREGKKVGDEGWQRETVRNIDGGKGARERWMGLLRLTQSKPLTHNIETETKYVHTLCTHLSGSCTVHK